MSTSPHGPTSPRPEGHVGVDPDDGTLDNAGTRTDSDVAVASETPVPERAVSGSDAPGSAAPEAAASEAAASEAAARAKKERIGRLVGMFLFPLLMVGMMVWGYLYAMHAPTPHDMPIAVTGQNAQSVASALENADPSAVDVRIVGSDADARQLVLDRDVAGAVSIDGAGATVYTAGAAGASQASAVSGMLLPQVAGQGFEIHTEDLAPLPQSDSAGLAAMFMTTGLMLAGYMPLSLILSTAPELLRKRRIVPLLAGWAALTAFFVWVIADPLLGAFEGHTAAVLGIAWLSVFSVGSVQVFLTRIFGPMAVLVGMLFLMVLGVPASNLGMSVHMMPSVYAALHTFLPAPATGEALRSVLYFGGQGVGAYMVVLAIGAVLAWVLTYLVDHLRHRKDPESVLPGRTMESLHRGRRPSTPVHYATLAAFPFAMLVMMVSLMLGAMYQPTPREMPVAIVASTSDQAQQVASGLEQNMPGMFDVHVATSAADARQSVEDRTVVAAFSLPSADVPHATLVTNQAAGVSQQQVVEAVFGQVSQAQGMPLEHDNVAPLDAADSMGTVSMYLAMGAMMAGMLIVVVGANAAPFVMRLKTLVPIVFGWSVFISIVLWLIAGPIVGAIDGHFLELVTVGTVATFCVAMFTTVLVRLFGLLAVLPAVAVLMFLGVPAFGGAMSVYMEPEVFRVLHGILPMPAAVESVRSVLYFGGDTVGGHLLTLGIWGVVSLVLVAVVDRLHPLPETDEAGAPILTDRATA